MLLSCIDVSLSFSLKAMKKMSSGEGYKKKVSQINVFVAWVLPQCAGYHYCTGNDDGIPL